MTTLLDIPPEVIAKILEYLSPNDIVSVSESCQELYRASQIDLVWKCRCEKDYRIKVGKLRTTSYKELYTKLLYLYGKLIGLWQSDNATAYGGLLQVQYQDGSLLGNELHAPHNPKITDPIRVRPLFSIALDESGQLLVSCVGGYGGNHKAEVDVINCKKFSFKCCDHEKHNHPSGKHREFLDWLRGETGEMWHNQEMLLMKFLLIRVRQNNLLHYQRLTLPDKLEGVPIQPGVFKGTYSDHGLELILLNYEEKDSLVKAVKVTGDPNVPAGELTFHLNLNFPMTLTAEDQESMANLAAVQAVEVPFVKTNNKPESQPFHVPHDCFERFSNLPKFCTGRYHGWGQIAEHGFQNPSFCQGHWIIFNEDMFAFIWLDLTSISVYHRVQELS